MQAELIGIICTIGKLFSMDNFRWADSIHVHHVDNMEACITANRLQALMKDDKFTKTVVEQMLGWIVIENTHEHLTFFLLALKFKRIIFRHQYGHRQPNDRHIGAVLNRCADEVCREVQIAAMNRHVREYDPRERENVDRLETQARIRFGRTPLPISRFFAGGL